MKRYECNWDPDPSIYERDGSGYFATVNGHQFVCGFDREMGSWIFFEGDPETGTYIGDYTVIEGCSDDEGLLEWADRKVTMYLHDLEAERREREFHAKCEAYKGAYIAMAQWVVDSLGDDVLFAEPGELLDMLGISTDDTTHDAACNGAEDMMAKLCYDMTRGDYLSSVRV